MTSQTLYINRDTHCLVDSSIRMLRAIICVLLLGNVAQGCHWFHHHRGKRSTTAQDTIHLRHYFANCLSSKLSGFDFASLVDYTVLSSAWYANNQLAICSDSGDTAQCWANKLDQFIDRKNILSGPVRGCIEEYAEDVGTGIFRHSTTAGRKKRQAATGGAPDTYTSCIATSSTLESEGSNIDITEVANFIENFTVIGCQGCGCGSNGNGYNISWTSKFAALTKADSPLRDVIRDCNQVYHPPEPFWSPWSAWSGCPPSCRRGSQARARTCRNASSPILELSASMCGGRNNQSRRCQQSSCASWSSWGQWSPCSASCGSVGVRQRTRVCNNSNYYNQCEGRAATNTSCFNPTCVGPCGFNATATNAMQIISSPNHPRNYGNNVRCAWILSAPSGYQVRLIISEGGVTENRYDWIEVFDGVRSIARIGGVISTPRELNSTTGSLKITFTTDHSVTRKGFNATFVRFNPLAVLPRGCARELVATPSLQNFSSPNYPNAYSNNLNCVWTIRPPSGQRVVVKIVAQTEQCCDYVEVAREGETSSTRLMGNVSEARQFTSRAIRVRFYTDGSITNVGFYATYKISQCGFEATATNTLQTIESPNYPRNYLNNINCGWVVIAPTGRQVIVTVMGGFLEINYDYLRIYDASTLLTQLSGRLTRSSFTSTSGKLRMNFQTDGSVVKTGFRLTYVTQSSSSAPVPS
uniref:deleted in malignant brain tumors 1 protein isoform X2 n=1 Tax=Ciona intestinalis TaxID=7719 RepID=UPI000EF50191|nr:deleted in malignant brain tumors 1 protein isoform X2 [Ciona intestinalis]|eukprot:XP_002125198.2 deleted in malignant brain tumors 1 protein isoform X2 [Ciona intestinalis]